MPLPAIDWGRPWLAPYRDVGARLDKRLGTGDSVTDALDAEAALAPPMLQAGAARFVAQTELPAGEAYEAFIARTACIPTRDTLHDLFNGIVWLAFPRLKRRLNELQAEQIARHGIGPTRGALRDVLTLFDENGAMLQAPEALLDALQRRDWQALFVTRRDDWAAARLTLFGHALLEKLTQPRKSITAHVWPVPAAADVQDHLCARSGDDWRPDRPGLPLPVLGVPRWWPANEAPQFYLDSQVFRPAPAAAPPGAVNTPKAAPL